MLKTLALLVPSVLLQVVVFAQTYTGRVVDQEDRPLPGAAVQPIRGNYGTVTDNEGRFSLTIRDTSVASIQISFVSYKTKTVPLTTRDLGTILLEEQVEQFDNVIVYAKPIYPITVQTVDKEELQERNLGQDIPILLQYEPSVISSSDAGNGVGYTNLRIRGSDQQRINTTINGIPLNDAESQGVFYVNLGDLASSVEQVTIQRGVGTSTNGAGAFGASVNFITTQPQDTPEAQVSTSFGSFNTRKHTLQGHTGKVGDHFSFYGRLSKIESDGYVQPGFTDLESFYFSAKADYGKHAITYNMFGGRERTFQAYFGVLGSNLEDNRRQSVLGDYDNETDNYEQTHYQLLYSFEPKSSWKVHAALHYTKGAGFFEQFLTANDPAFLDTDTTFAFYGLPDPVIGGDTLRAGDFIRRKWLDNDFYGVIFSVEKQWATTTLQLGGGINRYDGGRFGELTYGEFSTDFRPGYRYYDNESYKDDVNVYVKGTKTFASSLTAFVDLQVRRVDFKSGGYETLETNELERGDDFTFFNPKVGLSWINDRSEFYTTLGVAQKEPNLIDLYPTQANVGAIIDNREIVSRSVKAERLLNLELGYSYSTETFTGAINLYHMAYKDQLVPTGQFNDVGFPTRTNVDRSFRQGIELVAAIKPTEKVELSANATLSRNKINSTFTEFLNGFRTENSAFISEIVATDFEDTDIAASPNFIASSRLTYKPVKGMAVEWLSRYVGDQFLDNTQSDARKLEAYFVNDLRLSYQIKALGIKNIHATLLINNVLDHEYESSGFAFPSFFEGQLSEFNIFFPQAGRNVSAGLTLTF